MDLCRSSKALPTLYDGALLLPLARSLMYARLIPTVRAISANESSGRISAMSFTKSIRPC